MLPNYKTNDPRGWCGDPKRGAAMGRSTIAGDPDYSGKIVLRKVRLDSGGYDPNGTYFGWVDGHYVYWYASVDLDASGVGTIDGVLRAGNRHEARAEIAERYPNARFYR